MMNAGTSTTAAALTNSIYLLYKHPKALSKLREELGAATGTAEVPSSGELANLPYLRACIEESLRVQPASSFGIPRIVLKGGRGVVGQFIDEDATVSVPIYTLSVDPNTLENVTRFEPERWISGDKEKMCKAQFPFRTGPRACIGRSIAYFEQILVIGTLVRLFDCEFKSEDFELQTLERFKLVLEN
jgi:benzoate 4-monooxygenase